LDGHAMTLQKLTRFSHISSVAYEGGFSCGGVGGPITAVEDFQATPQGELVVFEEDGVHLILPRGRYCADLAAVGHATSQLVMVALYCPPRNAKNVSSEDAVRASSGCGNPIQAAFVGHFNANVLIAIYLIKFVWVQ